MIVGPMITSRIIAASATIPNTASLFFKRRFQASAQSDVPDTVAPRSNFNCGSASLLRSTASVELQKLQQTGVGNAAVHLCVRGVSHARALQRVGVDKRHAKMWITDGRCTREALLWGVGDGALPVGRFDLAFVPQVNEYNGQVGVQLKVLDWNAEGGGRSAE